MSKPQAVDKKLQQVIAKMQMVARVMNSPGIYAIKRHKDSNRLELEFRDKRFDMPKKVYGEHMVQRKLILDEYFTATKGIAALLYNLKGTGKSLLVKSLSNICIANNIPVLLVEEMLFGQDFSDLLNSLPNCVLVFDEFNIVYKGKNEQENLLSILDGMTNGKRLTLITANSIRNLPDPMKGRPGRIHFKMNFTGITEGAIDEAIYDFVRDGHNLDGEVIEYLLYLGRSRNDISWDVFNTMVAKAKGKTLDELMEALKYINIDINTITEFTTETGQYIKLLSDEKRYYTIVDYMEFNVRFQKAKVKPFRPVMLPDGKPSTPSPEEEDKPLEYMKEKSRVIWIYDDDPIDKIYSQSVGGGEDYSIIITKKEVSLVELFRNKVVIERTDLEDK